MIGYRDLEYLVSFFFVISYLIIFLKIRYKLGSLYFNENLLRVLIIIKFIYLKGLSFLYYNL